ncbi:hypothetical protein JXB28_04150 [Candidatus Woesearchaeota archaeon]|nr:hypothetical protein [Candidatus Woesearchaeota archaeon]
MSHKLELRIYESYLEKSKEFFFMLKERPNERFELSAIAMGTEEGGCITLTELITPERSRICITSQENFKSLGKQDNDGYDLISTHDRSMLTGSFAMRIKGYMQGREHNHPGKRKIPTVGDIISISDCQCLFKPGLKYFVEIIHNGSSNNIFYYRREDLDFLHSRMYRSGINQQRVEDWLQRNKKALSINNFEVVKGK